MGNLDEMTKETMSFSELIKDILNVHFGPINDNKKYVNFANDFSFGHFQMVQLPLADCPAGMANAKIMQMFCLLSSIVSYLDYIDSWLVGWLAVGFSC